MALITCPECGAQISDKAPVCIHCGYPIPVEKNSEFYSLELVNYSTRKQWYQEFTRLLHIFPKGYDAFCSWSSKPPYIIGTGISKDNAEWFKNRFKELHAEVNIQLDENCTTPNDFANKFAEEERNGIIHCPRCHAAAVTTGQRGFSILTGPIGSSKTTNRCAKCGYKWYPK